MKKCSVAAALILLPFVANGAEAVITGQGQVRSAPDYVELTISVESKCYPTPGDARKVNDDSSRKIVDFLNGKIKKRDPYNTVISTGGYTSAYQTWYEDKRFCENTFQKQTTIIFRTQDVKNFESLFDEIQNTVYKELARDMPNVIQASISYASMSNPVPGVSDEQRTQLEKQAIGLAFKDAKAKLSALFGEKGVMNLKMTSASELAPQAPMPIYQRRAPMAMMKGGATAEAMAPSAPVQFDDQEIAKTIYFTFSFDDINLP